MTEVAFTSFDELIARLPELQDAPKARGTVALIVRRPETREREVLEEGLLDLVHGLVGDNWLPRGNRYTPDGSAHPDSQINIMSVRVVAMMAPPERWPLAGDQFFVDLDLSEENCPAGTRLQFGEATLEVTEKPHEGCVKFASRFGKDAHRFVYSPEGTAVHARGLNARVVEPGIVRTGDPVIKVAYTA